MTKIPCITCQIEAKRQAGEELTDAEQARWMRGCTCTAESVAASLASDARITR